MQIFYVCYELCKYCKYRTIERRTKIYFKLCYALTYFKFPRTNKFVSYDRCDSKTEKTVIRSEALTFNLWEVSLKIKKASQLCKQSNVDRVTRKRQSTFSVIPNKPKATDFDQRLIIKWDFIYWQLKALPTSLNGTLFIQQSITIIFH